MIFTTLHSIVNNVLMRRKYPWHFYVEFLISAKDCLRELSLDDLRVINAKILPVNEYNAVELPNDYVDYIKVGVDCNGQVVRPLVESQNLTRIVNRGADFKPKPYFNGQDYEDPVLYYGAVNSLAWYGTNWNDYGEFIGRAYGYGAGAQDDVFSVFKERGQIQLTDYLTGVENIVLEYISNGLSSDAATKVDPYAIATIEAYIIWQMKANTRTYTTGEAELSKQEYINERKILRARMSPLTLDVLRRIIEKNTMLAPK